MPSPHDSQTSTPSASDFSCIQAVLAWLKSTSCSFTTRSSWTTSFSNVRAGRQVELRMGKEDRMLLWGCRRSSTALRSLKICPLTSCVAVPIVEGFISPKSISGWRKLEIFPSKMGFAFTRLVSMASKFCTKSSGHSRSPRKWSSLISEGRSNCGSIPIYQNSSRTTNQNTTTSTVLLPTEVLNQSWSPTS